MESGNGSAVIRFFDGCGSHLVLEKVPIRSLGISLGGQDRSWESWSGVTVMLQDLQWDRGLQTSLLGHGWMGFPESP